MHDERRYRPLSGWLPLLTCLLLLFGSPTVFAVLAANRGGATPASGILGALGFLTGFLMLFGFQAIDITLLVFELQRIAGSQVPVPLLERAFVQHLVNPVRRRNVEVMLALRTDIQAANGLFSEDQLRTAGTLHPEPLRNSALLALLAFLLFALSHGWVVARIGLIHYYDVKVNEG